MKYSHDRPFRLLTHFDIDGPLTLAFDRILQQSIRSDLYAASVLRIHTFAPSTLSIGYDRQRIIEDIDKEACRRDGVKVVFRNTSGTAVLKTGDEVCFTLVTSPRHWDNFSYKEMFRAMNGVILDVLWNLDIEARLAPENYSGGTYNCFANTDADEIIATDGRKLVGSGIYAKAGIFMMQGVIPLTSRYRDVVKYIDRNDTLSDRTPTSILEEANREISPALLAEDIHEAWWIRHGGEHGEFTHKEVLDAQHECGTNFQDRAYMPDKVA